MTRLTIGMPVYNGAATIAAALDSLLAQGFADFELIISDNGSTDATPAIAQDYAARDRRIRYVRQAEPLPAQKNFHFLLMEARSPYFMWAAADDLWAPDFAERNIACLDLDEGLVMSQSQVLFTVNGVPSHLATGTYPLLRGVRENAARFFENPADNSRYYGIYRTEALRRVYPERTFYALDWLVSAATLRYGRHNEIPDILMIRDSSEMASYHRALQQDHRFILWRVFPVLFMTLWLLRKRLLPWDWAMLNRLFRLNIYMHSLMGVRKFEGPAARYVTSHSLLHAIGLAAPRPGERGALGQLKSRLGRAAYPVWRAAPLTLGMRKAIKAALTGRWGKEQLLLAAPERPAMLPRAHLPLPASSQAWQVFRERPAAPPLSLLVIGDGGGGGGFALSEAARLAAVQPLDVVWAFERRGGFGARLFDHLPGVTCVELPDGSAPGALLNAAVAASRAPCLLILPAGLGCEADIVPAVLEGLAVAPLLAPQLLLPGGRLAAAGGFLSQASGVVARGAGADPDLPAMAHAADCDVALGGLAVRRDALPGGAPFATGPASLALVLAEFCLGRREALGATRYWPAARLRLEHAPEAGIEADAWRELAAQYGDTLLRLRDLRDHAPYTYGAARPLRVLYVDADTPTPDQNSGSIDAFNLMRCLKSFGFDVSFVPESNFAHQGHYTGALQNLGIEVLHHPHVGNLRQALERHGPFDVVILCRAYIADRYMALVRQLLPAAKVIFYTVDLHFLREQREAELSGQRQAIAAAARSRQGELASIAAADVTVLLSTYERDMVQRELPQARICVLPLLREIPERLDAPGPQGRRDILFVGTYQHPPNSDAAIYFVREVWPLIRARRPDARFFLVGSAVTPAVSALAGDGVEVLGFVPDLDPLLARVRVAVAPLRYGAGLKGKVASALQSGVPMVATSQAAEGSALRDGEELLIADTPQAMADAVLRLYEDDALWQAIVQRGFEFVRREFSLDANLGRIAAIFSRAGLASLRSDLGAMQADLRHGEAIFRPSKFWQTLASDHLRALAPENLESFKRSINNCYMQWLPSSFADPRMRLPMANFQADPSMLPVEVAAQTPEQPELADEVVGYGNFRPFANPAYLRFYAFYCGLLWDLMSRHASDDLYKTLSEPPLGRPIVIRHQDRAISQDLAQSLLEHYRIRELCRSLPIPHRPTYLELGAGYGRLAYVLLKARRCRYIIVDIPPALLVAKWYLSSLFPELQVFGYRSFASLAEVQEELDRSDLIFLSAQQMSMLPANYADISISISSLHEMLPAQIDRYKAVLQDITRHVIYFKQWKTWHNPIDDIDMGQDAYRLTDPWHQVLDTTDLANDEFVEQAWFR